MKHQLLKVEDVEDKFFVAFKKILEVSNSVNVRLFPFYRYFSSAKAEFWDKPWG